MGQPEKYYRLTRYGPKQRDGIQSLKPSHHAQITSDRDKETHRW